MRLEPSMPSSEKKDSPVTVSSWLQQLKKNNIDEGIIEALEKHLPPQRRNTPLTPNFEKRLQEYGQFFSSLNEANRERVIAVISHKCDDMLETSFNRSLVKYSLENKKVTVDEIYAYKFPLLVTTKEAENCKRHMRENLNLCIEAGLVDLKRVANCLLLLETEKDQPSIIDAFKDNECTIEEINEWANVIFTIEKITNWISDTPSIADKHLAGSEENGKQTVQNRWKTERINQDAKYSCLVGNTEDLAKELYKIVNKYSIAIQKGLKKNNS
ncbi:MAG: hypothetical protein H0T62_10900 [Parachlamydiaceae bacterium]|nr:hypothetical protein [Parachlamydiaceae bacterium]